tara:strand:- start:155 stop:289 length:135 start_codon:yes stop_codon:yes gene_type:complete
MLADPETEMLADPETAETAETAVTLVKKCWLTPKHRNMTPKHAG